MEKVVVIGLGRVGLPFALILAEAGFDVTGIDKNPELLGMVRRKEPPFKEEGCRDYLIRFVGKGLEPSHDIEAVVKADYVVITVGTPVDDNLNPVLEDLLRVVDQIVPWLHEGQTLLLRSTMSPRTTERVAKYIEERTGLIADKDIFVATCPERIAEGRALSELRTIPQIIGGIGPNSTGKAKRVFDCIGVHVLETDPLSAELAKLFTNMYRYIQFATGNEFFMITEHHGRSFSEVRRLVNTGYSRGGLAGAGFAAGPCLYKDGFFLLDSVPYTELITNSWRINENLPNFLVGLIQAKIPLERSRVAILGMAFKADVDDTRQSLSFRLAKLLRARGAIVTEHDPHVARFASRTLASVIETAEIVIIAVPHLAYALELPPLLHRDSNILVCDVWNVCGTDQTLFGVEQLPSPARTMASAEGRV